MYKILSFHSKIALQTRYDPSIQLIGTPQKIWSIPAIHGDIKRLMVLHDAIAEHFQVGERLVYHGNYVGHGIHSAQCVDEILAFRRQILATPGVQPEDLIYLRGMQEEMLRRLLQIAFLPHAIDTIGWMLDNGLTQTLESYGFDRCSALDACRAGVIGLTRWTEKIREKIRNAPGHETFFRSLKHAAHTDLDSAYPMLFVHAGLDANRALHDQGEAFWWEAEKFQSLTRAYAPFSKVIRGYDPARRGSEMNCIKATIDDGCGFGGALTTVAFSSDGQAAEHFAS